jgi:hypothetical protein
MEAGFELSLDLLSNGVKRGFILMKQDKERHRISRQQMFHILPNKV